MLGAGMISGRAGAQSLPLDTAYLAAKAAIDACVADGYPKSAAVVADLTGVEEVVLRAPGAPEPTVESARRKAYTVAKTGMSSYAFGKSKGFVDHPPNPPAAVGGARPAPAAGFNPFAGLPVYDNDPQLIPWGGGVPIKLRGVLAGSVALSGAPGPLKDESCALAGAAEVSN